MCGSSLFTVLCHALWADTTSIWHLGLAVHELKYGQAVSCTAHCNFVAADILRCWKFCLQFSTSIGMKVQQSPSILIVYSNLLIQGHFDKTPFSLWGQCNLELLFAFEMQRFAEKNALMSENHCWDQTCGLQQQVTVLYCVCRLWNYFHGSHVCPVWVGQESHNTTESSWRGWSVWAGKGADLCRFGALSLCWRRLQGGNEAPSASDSPHCTGEWPNFADLSHFICWSHV